MVARTPDERAGAFLAALEDVEILVVESEEEPTAVTPPAVLVELAAETRTGVTPLPELSIETRDFSDRVRFSLRFILGFADEEIDAVISYAHAHMPRGRR